MRLAPLRFETARFALSRLAPPLAVGLLLLTAMLAPRAEPVVAEAAPSEDKPAAKTAKNEESSDSLEKTGTIEAVTVYRGQALVTRAVELPGPGGLREVVVTDLPDQVIPSSIYAESADGVEVRSIRYRVRPVGQDVRDEVREIEQQTEEVQRELAANERFQKVAGEHKAYLDSLQKFVATTAQVELTKGVLNAETLQTLTEFILSERKALAEAQLKLEQEKEALQEKQNLLQRRRQTLAGGSAKTVREAIVFVNLTGNDGGRLRVRYLVDNASWTPSYNIRTKAEREKVLLEYNASVQQMTGEDWKNVEMTLSTATPSLVASAPDLLPLSVKLVALPQTREELAAKMAKNYSDLRTQLEQQQRQLEKLRNSNSSLLGRLGYGGSGGKQMLGMGKPGADRSSIGQSVNSNRGDIGGMGMGGGMMGGMGGMGGMGTGNMAGGAPAAARMAGRRMNQIAQKMQLLDLKAGEKAVAKDASQHAAAKEGVSVTYTLETPISMPSRSDRQLIQIASLPMEASFTKVAVPVLTESVYEQATVTNTSNLVLLAGPTSSFLAGRFVGHGSLPTVTAGEQFTAGFGIDFSLRAHRELLDKSATTQGGNKIVDFTYRLQIANFADEPATIRLCDRIPSGKEGEIAVELVSPGQPLSDDPAYQKTLREHGILRWIVEVPAGATGPNVFTLDYQFQMEFDKQKAIAGISPPENKQARRQMPSGGFGGMF